MITPTIHKAFTPWAHHELEIREGTSDGECFGQIFGHSGLGAAYMMVRPTPFDGVRLILDIGANVGYASAFFLSRFPNAYVFAVEPDEGNYDLLVRNTNPYAPRVCRFQGAAWNRDTILSIEERRFRDAREWSFQVREWKAGDYLRIPACSMNQLVGMARLSPVFGRDKPKHVDIVKIDIEGAEALIFDPATNDLSWLDVVNHLVIEIHDDSHFGNASKVVYDAMRDRPFERSVHGELTYFKRI